MLTPNKNPEDYTDTASPMMKQYWAIKKQHPTALLLFRMGDFYECFFDDAKRAAKLLNVVLTTRGTTKEGIPIPMAGVPFHAVEQYLAKLVRLGVSTVMAEQFGEPGNGLLERRVTRVITPGTVTESEWVGDKEDSVLAAAYEDEALLGVAWLNLSSGVFRVEYPVHDLETTLSRLQVSEVLVSDSQQLGKIAKSNAVPGFWFDKTTGEQSIKQHYKIDSLGAIGLENCPAGVACAGVLLRYVHETQGCIPTNLEWPTKERVDSHIVMDVTTRKNLEISEAMHGGVHKTLWGVLDTCLTSYGSRYLKRWLHRPERSQIEATARLSAVDSLRGDSQSCSWMEILDGVGDVERVSARLALGTATPKDLAGLRDAIASLSTLRAGLLEHARNTRLASIAWSFEVPTGLSELLNRLEENPRTTLRDGGVIRTGVDTELDEYRALLENSAAILSEMESQERDSTGIPNLRIEYNRNLGYAIEISNANVHKVPPHYQRRQTLKNVERYTTQTLKTFEEKALSAKDLSLKREKILYADLTEKLQKHLVWIQSMGQALAQLDVLAAFSRAANIWNYTNPSFTSVAGLTISKGRHPVVERFVENYAENSTSLGLPARTWILTGPNMGGKSTLMRQTALLTLMAYVGCPVPAQSMVVGPIDAIATRIGASDDVAGGRSTFMLEMEEAASIVKTATNETLVIMDEIGRGTSAADGVALAQAIVEKIHRINHSMIMFATHYHILTAWADAEPAVENWHMSVNSTEKLVFEHTVKAGPAACSYGVHVAALAGIPSDVIARATELMAEGDKIVLPDSLLQKDVFLSLDLDSMTPKQAWLWLEGMQKQNTAKKIKKPLTGKKQKNTVQLLKH